MSLATSCSSTKTLHNTEKVLKNRLFCYDGVETGLDSMIPTNGYYRQFNYYLMYDPATESSFIKDTTEINIWFLKDGTFKMVNKRIDESFWGNYQVFGDIIKVHAYQIAKDSHLFLFQKRYLHGYELWYSINDENELNLIYETIMSLDVSAREDYIVNEMENFLSRYSVASFVNNDSSPHAVDSPMLKYDWYICK